MRKFEIVGHISLDELIQARCAGKDDDFSHGDRAAPYRSPASGGALLAALGESCDLLWSEQFLLSFAPINSSAI